MQARRLFDCIIEPSSIYTDRRDELRTTRDKNHLLNGKTLVGPIIMQIAFGNIRVSCTAVFKHYFYMYTNCLRYCRCCVFVFLAFRPNESTYHCQIRQVGREMPKKLSRFDFITCSHRVELLLLVLLRQELDRVQVEQTEGQLKAGGEEMGQEGGPAHQPTPSTCGKCVLLMRDDLMR